MARSSIFCLALLAGAAGLLSPSQASAQAVLLDFTQTTCPPCQQMRPIIEQLAAQGYLVRAVDVRRDPEAAQRYHVTATPTFVVMIDGREHWRTEGLTSYAELARMMQSANATAGRSRGNVRGQSPGERGGLDLASEVSSPPPSTPATFAAGPAPERIVEIQQPLPKTVAEARDRAAAAPAPDAVSSSSTSSAPTAEGDLAARLVAATVRLSVEDPGGRSTGTGVVIDARSGEALVLTCGHLFRESAGKGAIEITTFGVGSAGVERRETVAGVLMSYDLDRDLALVRFHAPQPPAVAPVAPLGTNLEPGAPATSVGCNHGENPSPWATRITAINRYQGHPNVEAARAPVEGRSGGGLFNAQGQVIGICFAAEPKEDEGLYASLSSIQAKLDELQLSQIYQAPAGVAGPGTAPAAAGQFATASPSQPSLAVRGQDRGDSLPAGLNDNWPTAATAAPKPASAPVTPSPAGALASRSDATAAARLAPEEQAALEEIGRRAVNSEVICIIRPQSPEGRSEVIKLRNASPAFIQALGAAAAASPMAAAPGTALR